MSTRPSLNTKRPYTSDPTFANSLLAYLGEEITLPDNTEIRAIYHENNETDSGDLEQNVYAQYLHFRIPTANIVTLAAGQVVTYRGAAHYVPTYQKTGKGWSVFTLEPQ